MSHASYNPTPSLEHQTSHLPGPGNPLLHVYCPWNFLRLHQKNNTLGWILRGVKTTAERWRARVRHIVCRLKPSSYFWAPPVCVGHSSQTTPVPRLLCLRSVEKCVGFSKCWALPGGRFSSLILTTSNPASSKKLSFMELQSFNLMFSTLVNRFTSSLNDSLKDWFIYSFDKHLSRHFGKDQMNHVNKALNPVPDAFIKFLFRAKH